MQGIPQALDAYTQWFNGILANVPGVYHYSWFDLKRKIHTYKNFWSKHWASLYNKPQNDIPENNMFFDKSWADVTDDEIDEMSIKLRDKMGGWIFHSRVDFTKPTPHVTYNKSQPACMQHWCENINT